MNLHPACIPVKSVVRRHETVVNAWYVPGFSWMRDRHVFSGGRGRRFESSHSDQ